MLKTISSVFLKSSLVVVSYCFFLPVVAQSAPESTSNNGYPADFAPNYTQNCIKSGTDKGIKPDIVNSYCSCTLTQLQAQIPFDRFQSIMVESRNTGNSSPEIQAVFQSCQKSLKSP